MLKFDIMELLLRVGADVNVRSYLNSTPLHDAIASGNLAIARLLLNYGADPNSSDKEGVPLLNRARRFRKSDVVELLLSGGADVNFRTYNSTPLHETSASHDCSSTTVWMSTLVTGKVPVRYTRHRDHRE